MTRSIPDAPLTDWQFFDPRVACVAGVPEAIILADIHRRFEFESEYCEGEPWLVCPYEEWIDIFPYWSPHLVVTIINRLIRQGFLKTTRLAQRNHDTDKWLAIDHAALDAAWLAYTTPHPAP